ncbi:MAG: hypothetical protein HY658_03740 [Actinobacteria bacterium]|nr:hypothetical protein [Actinomycetota bacterium]
MAAGAVHVATGFAIGTHLRSLPGAFLAGFASHAVFDSIPHHDYRTPSLVLVDLAAGAAALAAMAARHRRRGGRLGPPLAAAAGAGLPDVENVLWWLGYVRKEARLYPTHGGPVHQLGASFRFTGIYYALAALGSWLAMSRRPRR